MKKTYFVLLFLVLSLLVPWQGLAKDKQDPVIPDTPDGKALYELMTARNAAVNAKNFDMIVPLYTKDAPELEWIKKKGIPTWKKYGMKFKNLVLKKMSIIGDDAAASFSLTGRDRSGGRYWFVLEVLYVKVDSLWKIESVIMRSKIR